MSLNRRFFFAAFLLCCFCCAVPVWPQQTVDDLEKRIAALPSAERAYERFRFWSTQLPPDQRGRDILTRYRAYLGDRGFSSAEIDDQIKVIESQGARAEVDRWNRILTSEKPAF